jgi:hypothetical protein
MITQADRIRRFVLDSYITPARARGHIKITIRAGDVHQAMGLANAMPAVCSAIGSHKFEEFARVAPITRTGPYNGANVYFQFSLTANPLPTELRTSPEQRSFGQRTMDHIKRVITETLKPPNARANGAVVGPRPLQNRVALDLGSAIVLVSCVKSKLPYPAPARALYTSAWFRKTRDMVEASGARWFILSSLYGLVTPDAEIAPYDHTLNTLGVGERREWAKKVLAQLLPEIGDERRIVMFAGQRYREFLVGPLEHHGKKVDVPMEHLARGEQLAWLSETE